MTDSNIRQFPGAEVPEQALSIERRPFGLAQENPLTIDSETGEITPPGDARDGDPMTAELRRVCAAIDAGQDPYPSPAQPTTEPAAP